MKSGTLWAHWWGLALADFGRDPPSSDSLRGSRIFCQANNARFHWFSVGQILRHYEHNVDPWGGENLRNRILKILPYGVVFQKTQKLLKQFPSLATSGRHNSAMITDRRNFTTKFKSTGCLVSIFTVIESIQSLSPGMYTSYRKRTYPHFRQPPMSDIAY